MLERDRVGWSKRPRRHKCQTDQSREILREKLVGITPDVSNLELQLSNNCSNIKEENCSAQIILTIMAEEYKRYHLFKDWVSSHSDNIDHMSRLRGLISYLHILDIFILSLLFWLPSTQCVQCAAVRGVTPWSHYVWTLRASVTGGRAGHRCQTARQSGQTQDHSCCREKWRWPRMIRN